MHLQRNFIILFYISFFLPPLSKFKEKWIIPAKVCDKSWNFPHKSRGEICREKICTHRPWQKTPRSFLEFFKISNNHALLSRLKKKTSKSTWFLLKNFQSDCTTYSLRYTCTNLNLTFVFFSLQTHICPLRLSCLPSFSHSVSPLLSPTLWYVGHSHCQSWDRVSYQLLRRVHPQPVHDGKMDVNETQPSSLAAGRLEGIVDRLGEYVVENSFPFRRLLLLQFAVNGNFFHKRARRGGVWPSRWQ